MDLLDGSEATPISKNDLLSIIFRQPDEEEKSSFLFTHPLYHIRKDIRNCLFPPSYGNIESPCSYWVATISILTGIELLASIFSGDKLETLAYNRNKEKNYKDFLEAYINKYGSISSRDKNNIWMLRNSLIHNTGLIGFNSRKKSRVYALSPDKTNSVLFDYNGTREYDILLSIYCFYIQFEKMVSFLWEYIENCSDINGNDFIHEMGGIIWKKTSSGASASMVGRFRIVNE
jgi:hypothetical protein